MAEPLLEEFDCSGRNFLIGRGNSEHFSGGPGSILCGLAIDWSPVVAHTETASISSRMGIAGDTIVGVPYAANSPSRGPQWLPVNSRGQQVSYLQARSTLSRGTLKTFIPLPKAQRLRRR